ncbi:unnamed protein product, partial [Tetraodon nigroviridis]
NAVHARRLQRSRQPFSHWHQEHFDHHQHGVAELLQRVAQEEAGRGRRLRRLMMEKAGTAGPNCSLLTEKPVWTGKPAVYCNRQMLLWCSSKKQNPSLA